MAARCSGVYALAAAGPAARPAAAPAGEALQVGVDAEAGAPAGRLRVGAEGGQRAGPAARRAERRRSEHGGGPHPAGGGGARRGRASASTRSRSPRSWGSSRPEAQALLAARLAPVERRLGAWTDSAARGGAARGGRWYTYARCGFARGSAIAELGWAGPTAETLRLLDALPAQLFLLEAPGVFAAFDVRTGVIVRAAFELPPAGGPATAVTLRSGGAAAVQAMRLR